MSRRNNLSVAVVTAALITLVAGVPAAFAEGNGPDNEGIVAASIGSSGFAAAALDGDVYPMIFPHVGGVTTGYSDTFGACRGGAGCPRRHEGIDIMAPKMVPIVAVASGTVGWIDDEQGGDCCAMALEHDDGWQSWYIHMNNDTPGTDDGQGWGFADGIAEGVHVGAGQLIGWVGDSGNAESTGSHTHFELHQPDGTVINPYPHLVAAAIIDTPWVPSTVRGCDFESDGFDDVVVGIPGKDRGVRDGAGAVVVVPGSDFGPGAGSATVWHQRSPGVDDKPDDGDGFGAATGCGDFDGDGFDDLVVGVPGEDQNRADSGAVNVLYGSAEGLAAGDDDFWHQNREGVPDANRVGDAFGSAVAVGDFDGDGRAEAAIAAPGAAVGTKREAGLVFVFAGDAGGIGSGAVTAWWQGSDGTVDTPNHGDRFGAAMAVGDFDGDGYHDLAVGAPGENLGGAGAGMVTVLFGSDSGLVAGSSVRLAQGSGRLAGVGEPGDWFGAALAAGDFDGDGSDDLVIGVPGQVVSGRAGAGAAYVVPGSPSGLRARQATLVTAAEVGVAFGAGAFGSALTVGETNGDGFDDLGVGVPGAADGAGLLVVLYGSAEGVRIIGSDVLSQDSRGIRDAAEPGDGFAATLSSGDFDGSGAAWLLVGVPSEDIGIAVDAGALHVMRGGPGGVRGGDGAYLRQGSPGVPGRNGFGDEFGHLGVAGP